MQSNKRERRGKGEAADMNENTAGMFCDVRVESISRVSVQLIDL